MFHAPLTTDENDIILPLAGSIVNGTPSYSSSGVTLTGASAQIRWRPLSEDALNGKLRATAYAGTVRYKCTITKGTPSGFGSSTYRFFTIYNTYGYSGFLMQSSGVVRYIDYRVFPSVVTYEANIGSSTTSVYELAYEGASDILKFYVDGSLVYTSLFSGRLVDTGIQIATPNASMDTLIFKDCMMLDY